MYGYIYITTNTINNKQYIGQHKSEVFDEKYKGSGKRLKLAFAKYGKENFTCQILQECFSKEELDQAEIHYINSLDCVNSTDFYNLKEGGSGGGQKGLVYIRRDRELKRVPKEELDIYLQQGFELGGYIPGEEERQNRAQAHVGLKYQHSKEFLEHGSKSRGSKRPREIVEKIAERKRGSTTSRKGKISIINEKQQVLYIDKEKLSYYESLGYRRGFKKHSLEACRNLQRGKSGTVVIHRGDEIKYVQPCRLESYLAEGWLRGRGKATRPNQKAEHRKWMNNGLVNKMVKQEEIASYLENGFVFGKIV